MSDKMYSIVCKKCGHETSGPNEKSVKETAARHMKKQHGWTRA